MAGRHEKFFLLLLKDYMVRGFDYYLFKDMVSFLYHKNINLLMAAIEKGKTFKMMR